MRRYFFPCDVAEILKIKIPANRCADWIAWNFEKTGVFSVRSAYRLALQLEGGGDYTGSSARPDGVRCLWKNLWSAQVPSKVSVSSRGRWHGTGCLPELTSIAGTSWIRRIASSVGCGFGREDMFHAVVGCPHAKALRDAMCDQ